MQLIFGIGASFKFQIGASEKNTKCKEYAKLRSWHYYKSNHSDINETIQITGI